MESDYQKFLSDLDVIKKASETKKLVIFIGAGLSINSGLPSWNSLIKELKEDIGIDKEDIEDPLQVAQVYYNQRKHKEYVEKIRDLLHHKKKKYNDLHEAIFDLKPEHIVTTNYDDFLEQVIKKRALSFSVIKQDKDFPYASNTNLLVKIHGDLDNDDFVLKEDDYLNYEQDHPLFEAFIKSLFSTKIVLFVGYSYSDFDLKIILQKVKNILGKDYQNSYLISPEQLSNYKIDYLRNKGVNVLNYYDNQNYVNQYLDGENSKNLVYKFKSNQLLEHGQKLLDIITFIKYYDRFKERLAATNFIDQVYFSLSRYSELKSLPYYFISNLFPFNNTSLRTFNDEQGPFVLAVKNYSLLEFFSNNIIQDDTGTTYNNLFIDKYNTNDLKEYRKKLKKIIDVLNFSCIYYMALPSNDSDYQDKNVEAVLLQNEERASCECLDCLFNDLKFDKVLINSFQNNITETSSISDDALLAITHYKLGNFYNSFNLFEEVARKAWHSGKYITYFIAKYNYKRVARYISFGEYQSISEEELKKVHDRSASVDLDDIYRQINDVSKEEAELIRIIRDDNVLKYCSEQLQALYRGSVHVHENLVKGTKYFTPKNYTVETKFYLEIIDNFYGRNYIVQDLSTDYINTVNIGLKILIINFKFNKSYSEKLDEFDETFCRNFIHHADVSEFVRFLKVYQVDKINISASAKEDLIELVNAYLSSYLLGKDLFGAATVNKAVHSQSLKGRLNNRLLKYFDRLFILLSLVELDGITLNSIYPNLITYLNTVDLLYWKNIEYLSMFIKAQKKCINIEMYSSLLNVLVKNSKLLTKEILEEIGFSLRDRPSEYRLSDVKLIDTLKLNFLKLQENNSYKGKRNILFLWMIVDDENRLNIKNDIEKILIDKFDSQLYTYGCFWNIIDFDFVFVSYVEEVNGAKSSNIEFDEEGSVVEVHSWVFINFVIFIYYVGVPFDDDRLKIISDKEQYISFFLNPESFDYSLFNPLWLTLADRSFVHKKLSKYKEIGEALTSYLRKNPEDKVMCKLFASYYI